MHVSLRLGADRRRTALSVAVALAFLCTSSESTAAAIALVNGDCPGEGFNDPTPVAPVGGNHGTTLGEQRQIAFQYAADLFGVRLKSSVRVDVDAAFDQLPCGSSSAILGAAGPRSVNRDFPGAPLPLTWYTAALANSLANADLDPNRPEIGARFNSKLGKSGCLGGIGFYLGLDASPGGDIDFVSVVAHELAHGLGFLSLVDQGSGALFQDLPDVYIDQLEDHGLGATWRNMTSDERRTSAVNTGGLHWVGPRVTGLAAARLTSGLGAGGHVEMFAPSTVQFGSSVSHFSNSLSPSELMEPSYQGPTRDLDLTTALLEDVGWSVAAGFCSDGIIDPGETCDDGNLLSGDGCDSNCTVTGCGNAVATAGEQCDDGNLDDGDCCSAGCIYEPVGGSCLGGVGTCSPNGDCELPAVCGDGKVGSGEDCDDGNLLDGDCCSSTCRFPSGCLTGARAKLSITNRCSDKRDRISWKMSKGDALAQEELGDPTVSTSYTLCLYDERSGRAQLATSLTVAPSNEAWEDDAPRGFSYKNREADSDGVQKLRIKTGDSAKSGIQLKAKGSTIPMPVPAGLSRTLGQDPRVSVFVIANDMPVCWYTEFPVSSTKKNTSFSFKAIR